MLLFYYKDVWCTNNTVLPAIQRVCKHLEVKYKEKNINQKKKIKQYKSHRYLFKESKLSLTTSIMT